MEMFQRNDRILLMHSTWKTSISTTNEYESSKHDENDIINSNIMVFTDGIFEPSYYGTKKQFEIEEVKWDPEFPEENVIDDDSDIITSNNSSRNSLRQ